MLDSLDAPLILVVAGWVSYVIAMSVSRLLSGSRILPDNPNHRSSHERATSRAGGLAIYGGWFAGLLILAAFSGIAEIARISLSLGGLALLALGIGFADDKWMMSSFWKFAGQVAVATLFVAVFGPLILAPLPFVGLTVLGTAGVVVTVFWIVGFMNAYNFMDGANGIAAGAASVGLSAFAIITAFSGALLVAAVAILLAIACFGFLPANLARGKIFMGDNGSQSISFAIACLGVYAANETRGDVSALVMPVIFLPFIFDVTWTLGHRILRKKNILAAHREHNYQILLRLGASHLRVALIYMALTAFSSAVAILMLALPPGVQWLAPALLSVLFAIAAIRLFRTAEKTGLLDQALERGTPKLKPLDPLQRAAE
jgi:UDP-N-acetylmuramyl pentapeptide phosphotransferase/UDP-N-acetylglucosamine-1-phosphate transferase